MLHQGVRLILGDHADTTDTGVKTVGERKINNTELAAKVNRRLGACGGQVFETRATPTRQDQGYRF